MNYKDEIVGKDFKTNNCGECTVLEYKSCRDVTVLFKDPEYVTKCRLDDLRRGCVNNPLTPRVCGVGFLGIGKFTTVLNKREYKLWLAMLQRCYGTKSTNVRSSYKNVTVCNEWHNFQNFAEWCEAHEFFNAKDKQGKSYQLDKDILVKGDKTYSPETCCFVPREINNLLVKPLSHRKGSPTGVCLDKRRNLYAAQVNCFGRIKHLGYYKTSEHAFAVYKGSKEAHIKDVAEKWKGLVTSRVYLTLVGWEINCED